MGIRKFFRSMFQSAVQRGQVMVLYAFLIPLMFMFLGVGMDLGWYYLNVSRLQNAADAAAVAGAHKLISDNPDSKFSDYSVSLVENRDFSSADTESETAGDAEAAEYVRKNLSSSAQAEKAEGSDKAYTMTDNWSRGGNSEVTMTPSLYKIGDDFYYVITLEEKVEHLFMPGWFNAMNAPVTAVALLTKTEPEIPDPEPEIPEYPPDISINVIIQLLEHGGEIVTNEDNKITQVWINERNSDVDTVNYQNKRIIDGVEDTETVIENYTEGQLNSLLREGETATKVKARIVSNWEYLQKNKDFYQGIWCEFQNSVISYGKDNKVVYRTENMLVQKGKEAKVYDEKLKEITNLSGENLEKKLSSIDIDFIAEFMLKKITDKIYEQFTEDWDLREGHPPNLGYYKFSDGNWDKNFGYDLRIHSAVTFGVPYKNRSILDDSKDSDYPTPDPLYVRIESEPILPIKDKTDHASYNSVRQIILNMNGDNSDADTYRPLVIFYDGPEQFDENNTVRFSQPVVINFNANFNGIIYMPNSPVIIRGNEKKFTGFVVAKEFRVAMTEEDYINPSEDSDKVYNKVTDTFDNTIFIEPKYLLDGAPKYFILDVTDTNGLEKYKNALKTYRNLTDGQISMVTLANDDGYTWYTDAFPVATDDLLDTDPDPNEAILTDKYVKVLLDNNEIRYIGKVKLPHIKIIRNGHVPHVPICDIKSKKPVEKDYSGVTLADDNDKSIGINEINNYYVCKYNKDKDQYNNYIFIYKNLTDYFKNGYEKIYDKDKVNKIIDENGCRYFTLKSEENDLNTLVSNGTLRKVTDDENNVGYIEEKDASVVYFTKVVPEGSGDDNYIIVDKKGDLQVKDKPLSDPSYNATRPTNSKEKPLKPSGLIKDPSLEVVYKMDTAFNLSTNSRYSSFDIKTEFTVGEVKVTLPVLKRKYYQYLDKGDSVDMFFTTERAKWIQ